MKKVILMMVLCICFAPCIFSKELIVGKKVIYQTGLSFGFASGIIGGIGWTNQNGYKAKEEFVNFHYHKCHYFYATGIYYQANLFNKKIKKGFFCSFEGGIDYIEGFPIFYYNIGGTEADDKPLKYAGIIPNIAVGIGYQFKVGSNNYSNIYWDIGVKQSISNINISYKF